MPRKRELISVICTVKNEGTGVLPLIESLLSQERKPDEIIFADGGSTDGTPGLIRRKYGRAVKVFVEKGANIGRGRNLAISHARGPWIASIDGGCVADRRWLGRLEARFGSADVVSGAYYPLSSSKFEKIQGFVVCKPAGRLAAGFLPSSRSVAFRKSCWAKAGKYPEDTYTAEDTIFDMRLKQAGCRFALARDALVGWRMRHSLKSFARQFYLYGYGDGRSGALFRMPANVLLVSLAAASIAALAFPNFLPAGLLSAAILAESAVIAGAWKAPLAFAAIVFLDAVKRVAYCAGALAGVLQI